MNTSKSTAIYLLLKSKSSILDSLEEVIKNNKFNYKTFGTEIEPHLEKILVKIFKSHKIIKNKKDYKIAKDKNEFPDFILKATKPELILEFKSGNLSKKLNGKWVKCNNSNNDMGTLNKWEEKINKFGGDNIYYIFIIYDFDNSNQKICDVQIEPFYKFIGINSDKMLKYREKDGNLRPKNFNEASPITNLNIFECLLEKTIIYRSEHIIRRHIENIPKIKRNNFLESLKI